MHRLSFLTDLFICFDLFMSNDLISYITCGFKICHLLSGVEYICMIQNDSNKGACYNMYIMLYKHVIHLTW